MATYNLIEEGYTYDTVEADSASEALDGADPASTGDYDTSDGTVWIEIIARKVCDCCDHRRVEGGICKECDESCSHADDLDGVCCDCECPLHGNTCVCDEDEASRTFAIDPDVPDCTEGEHDWQEPYEILGGLKENPGVWGHGGGIIMRSVCMHCGCERVTDTWAQRPDTGEQGLTSVSYEPGKYADDVRAFGVEIDA